MMWANNISMRALGICICVNIAEKEKVAGTMGTGQTNDSIYAIHNLVAECLEPDQFLLIVGDFPDEFHL